MTYNVSVATGDGEDNGTTSNIYVDICGPKNRHTGKLFLDLTGKDRFEPGSTESFSLEGLDVDEVRKIKVCKNLTCFCNIDNTWYHFVCQMSVNNP